MIYYSFHIIGFIATLLYLYWVFPKYGVKRLNGFGLAACTYLTAYAISVLILVSTDRSCFKCMRTAKEHAYISMCSGLVFT